MAGDILHARGTRSLIGAMLLLLVLLLTFTCEAGQRALQIVDVKGKPVGLYKASYALVIGVSDYTNGWPDLPGVEQDVAQVRVVLEEQGFEVTMVRNPTRRALREAFDTFIARYGLDPEHRLVIYFAGHGHTIKRSYGEEVGYIVPADAPNPHRDGPGFLSIAAAIHYLGQCRRTGAG